MTGSTDDWSTAPLVALDLEGTGAQDHDNEAILEVAVVPLVAGQPDTAALVSEASPAGATLTDLLAIATVDLSSPAPAGTGEPTIQDTLFDAQGAATK